MRGIFNAIIEVLKSIFTAVISFLPDSPFKSVFSKLNLDTNLLGYLNWIFPVGEIVSIFAIWVSAVLAYYLIMQILRFVKVIK